MIEISEKTKTKLDNLEQGETFQLADTFYQKTNAYSDFTGTKFSCVNLETGKLTYIHINQKVIPKDFILKEKEE
jgi:hypothetical protein